MMVRYTVGSERAKYYSTNEVFHFIYPEWYFVFEFLVREAGGDRVSALEVPNHPCAIQSNLRSWLETMQ